MQRQELDPVTFEIIKHNIEEIVGEMFYVMGRVSGSPIIYGAGDHEEAILDADGEAVMLVEALSIGHTRWKPLENIW